MGKASHLYRRNNLWYWRRRVTRGPARGRPIALSLGTEERGRARRAGAALDAVFEELMSEADDRHLPPGTYEAIMLAARDAILLRLAGEHAARGPDPVLPAAPPIRDEAEVPPKTQAKLAAFLARLEAGDAGDGGTTGASVPTALADELLRLLPKPTRLPKGQRQEPTLPSRTTVARARAQRSRAIAEILRADRAANDFSAARELAGTVLGRLGLSLTGQAAHQAGSAVMEGMIKAYLHDVDVNLRNAAPTKVEPPIGWGPPGWTVAQQVPAPSPDCPVPSPSAATSNSPATGPCESPAAETAPAVWDGSLSPDMPLSEAYAACAKEKIIERKWKDETARDALIAIRLFIEFFGDLPLRAITRKHALQFREDIYDLCSDWGTNPEYADPTPDNPNRRVTVRRAVEISRERRKANPALEHLSERTIKKHTGPLNVVWTWAADNAGCDDLKNPFAGLQRKLGVESNKSDAQENREAYQIAEVHLMFTSKSWLAANPFTDSARTALKPNAKPCCLLNAAEN